MINSFALHDVIAHANPPDSSNRNFREHFYLTQWETGNFAALGPVNVEITTKIPEGLFFVTVN